MSDDVLFQGRTWKLIDLGGEVSFVAEKHRNEEIGGTYVAPDEIPDVTEALEEWNDE